MKLSFSLLILLALPLLSFSQAPPKKKVLATASMISDMTKNIAGDLVEVSCIVPIGGDPHIYEPTPADAAEIFNADLVLKNGLTFEGWINELIATSGTSAEVVTVTEGVEPIQSLDYANATDPHAWMDVKKGLKYIKNIYQSLLLLIPESAGELKFNYEKYRDELVLLDQYIKDKIATIPAEKRVIITSHDAFQYYGRAYGLRLESVLGTSTDAEVQTSDVQNLYDVIKETKVPAIFVETTINPKLLRQISQDNHVKIGGKLYADSIGDEDSDGNSYYNMLKANTDKIARALTSPEQIVKEEIDEGSPIMRALLFGIIGFLFIGGFAMMFIKLRATATQVFPKDKEGSAAICVSGLSVSYDQKVVLSNIYCEISAGQIYGVIGPNGAGKSTLFKSILGLLEPNAGTILIHGNQLQEQKRRVAYVPQKNDVDWNFPATVKDVVQMGRFPHLEPLSGLRKVDQEIVDDALKEMGIQHLAERQIGALSGGQQQRVFLARAVAQQADIFLLDEPFVGVDITTEEKIIKLLKKLATKGKTVLVIHHDLSSVKAYFDSIILLNQRLVAYGPTETTFTDQNLSKAYAGQLAILQKTGI